MRRSRQMSESIELGIVLALAGGFMDAYSYMCRDGVFANAQTGNMLLLGINLSERNWGMALHYLFPVLAFHWHVAYRWFASGRFMETELQPRCASET